MPPVFSLSLSLSLLFFLISFSTTAEFKGGEIIIITGGGGGGGGGGAEQGEQRKEEGSAPLGFGFQRRK